VLVSLGARIREIKFPPTLKLLRGWIPFCSVETAIAESIARHGDAAVAIIPEGPYVVPVHERP